MLQDAKKVTDFSKKNAQQFYLEDMDACSKLAARKVSFAEETKKFAEFLRKTPSLGYRITQTFDMAFAENYQKIKLLKYFRL